MTQTVKPDRVPVVPYPQRWTQMTDDEKRAIVGDDFSAFDDLLSLDEGERERRAEQASIQVRAVAARYGSTDSRLKTLKVERDRLMVQMALLGIPKASIARAAGVGDMTVSFAVFGRESTRAGRKGLA